MLEAKKHKLDFESLPYAPYSPDLARRYYYLFPNLKRWPCGGRFESNEIAEWEIERYFGGFDKSNYVEGIGKLEDT